MEKEERKAAGRAFLYEWWGKYCRAELTRGADCLSNCRAWCMAMLRTSGDWNTTARISSVKAPIEAPVRCILSTLLVSRTDGTVE